MFDTAVRSPQAAGSAAWSSRGGHINPEPLAALTEVVDAIKIDLKSFTPEFYKTYVRGDLEPVLEAIKLICRRARPGSRSSISSSRTLNDDPAEVRKMAGWLAR